MKLKYEDYHRMLQNNNPIILYNREIIPFNQQIDDTNTTIVEQPKKKPFKLVAFFLVMLVLLVTYLLYGCSSNENTSAPSCEGEWGDSIAVCGENTFKIY